MVALEAQRCAQIARDDEAGRCSPQGGVERDCRMIGEVTFSHIAKLPPADALVPLGEERLTDARNVSNVRIFVECKYVV